MPDPGDSPTIVNNISGDAHFQMVDAPESSIGDISGNKGNLISRQVRPIEARIVGYLMLGLAGASLIVQIIRLVEG